MTNIKGNELIHFFENLGCNTRESSRMHTSMWSIYTGDFFVVPSNNEPIDKRCLEHIILQLGITRESFNDMWNQFKSSGLQGR